MRVIRRILTIAVLLMISCGASAATEACRNELRALIVPPLEHVAMNKKDLLADIEDVSDGVYSVRLYVAADSPDNLDKEVSIGWVNLDTEHPDVLKVDEGKYRKFISDCIRKVPKAASSCDDLNKNASTLATDIPHSERGMVVVGNGRLQFYSAPDYACKMRGVFVLSGETVGAYVSYHGFTSVAYQNSKATSVRGWVRSDRLRPNSLAVAPRQAIVH